MQKVCGRRGVSGCVFLFSASVSMWVQWGPSQASLLTLIFISMILIATNQHAVVHLACEPSISI